MNDNNKLSISFVIALASMLAAISPALPMLPAFAQSDGDDDTSSSSNYEEFVNCLGQSEGDKGYASESEIRDCFRPIYDPQADTAGDSITSDSSSGDGIGGSSTTDSSSNDDSDGSSSSDDDSESTSSNNSEGSN
ncbi:MAG: hypothetical protein R2685_03525 [Candidatus Nitrosocosmicus sp.]|jgi:hypothetical protein|nr:hypothetical protein [Candidatus Nitrosocosmicus sp.]